MFNYEEVFVAQCGLGSSCTSHWRGHCFYYVGMDDTDDALHIGVGQAIGTTPYVTLLASGKVGIGDITPAFGGLVVADGVTIGSDANANALIDDATNGAGSTVLYIGQNTIDTTAPSDKRLKQNIVRTELKLEQLLKLNVVDFQYIADFTTDRTLHHGLIAQEVESVYPYAVSVRSDGFKMVNYGDFIPLLITSLQEQQQEILQMEALNTSFTNGSLTLSERITTVEDLVKKLELQGLTLETRLNTTDTLVADQQSVIVDIEAQLARLTQNNDVMASVDQEVFDQEEVFTFSEDEPTVIDIDQMVSDGMLVIETPVEFRGPTIFQTIAEFIDTVIFRNNVEFAGHVLFNQDTAGYALISEGQDRVAVTFEKEYADRPIINASLSLQQIDNDEVRQAAEELLLISDIKFIITNVTTKGFEIRISQKAFSEIPFSWQAIAINDPKTFSQKVADNDATQEADETSAEIPAEDAPVIPESTLPAEIVPSVSESTPPAEATAPVSEDTSLVETVLPVSESILSAETETVVPVTETSEEILPEIITSGEPLQLPTESHQVVN